MSGLDYPRHHARGHMVQAGCNAAIDWRHRNASSIGARRTTLPRPVSIFNHSTACGDIGLSIFGSVMYAQIFQQINAGSTRNHRLLGLQSSL